MMSKVLVRLLEIQEKPEHPIDFICENLGPTRKETVQIEILKQEVAEYRNQVEDLKRQLEEVTMNRSESLQAIQAAASDVESTTVDVLVTTSSSHSDAGAAASDDSLMAIVDPVDVTSSDAATPVPASISDSPAEIIAVETNGEPSKDIKEEVTAPAVVATEVVVPTVGDNTVSSTVAVVAAVETISDGKKVVVAPVVTSPEPSAVVVANTVAAQPAETTN